MKIKKIESILSCFGRNYLIVKITTDDGIIGYGDATLNGRELAVKSIIDNYLSDFLKEKNASRIEDIWQMIFKGTYWRNGPVLTTALAGIDMALWDIKGKKVNMPLYSLLKGKCRDKLKIYIHVHGKNEDELLDRCAKKINNGYKVLRYSFDIIDPSNKKNILHQPHQDLEISRIEELNIKKIESYWDSEIYISELIRITKKIRQSFGNKIELIHDIHGRLSLSQAIRLSHKLEDYSLFFLEDPIDPMNKEALKKFKYYTYTPIATGELFTNLYDFKDIISNQAIAYIRADISHIGGITPLLKLSTFAELYDIQTAFHGPSDISPIAHSAMAHINACISNFGIQEYVENIDNLSDVFKTPLKIKDGYLEILPKAGIGVEINEEIMKKYPYKKAFLPILRDRMGAIHNW